MITVVTGTEIEKLKGEFESVINGMNMVGEISFNVYSELFDVGTDFIQKAYELDKVELQKENAELKSRNQALLESCEGATMMYKDLQKANNQLTKAKELIKDLLGSENTSCEEEMYFEIRQKAKQFLKK